MTLKPGSAVLTWPMVDDDSQHSPAGWWWSQSVGHPDKWLEQCSQTLMRGPQQNADRGAKILDDTFCKPGGVFGKTGVMQLQAVTLLLE